MLEVKDTQPTPPKKPLIFYYLIAMVVVMLLNALLFPSLLQRQVTEVGYNQFLDMVGNGQVKEVAYEDAEDIRMYHIVLLGELLRLRQWNPVFHPS